VCASGAVHPFGMKLIIQHGLLGAPRNWRSVVERLGSSVSSVEVPWLRGHGSGQAVAGELSLRVLAEDLDQLLQKQTEPFVVLGSSVGGLTIMQYLVGHSCSRLLQGAIIVDVAPVFVRPAAMPDLDKVSKPFMPLICLLRCLFRSCELFGEAFFFPVSTFPRADSQPTLQPFTPIWHA
jgi:pimeloyl-ACP methyl ester carboxylesterase